MVGIGAMVVPLHHLERSKENELMLFDGEESYLKP